MTRGLTWENIVTQPKRSIPAETKMEGKTTREALFSY